MNIPEKAVVKYTLEFHRSANLEGAFIMTKDDFEAVKDMEGAEIHYGEISGKHSNVACDLILDEIEIITVNQEEINVFEKLFPNGIGFNFKSSWFNEDRAKDDGYDASTMSYSSAEEAIKDFPSIKGKKLQKAFIESYNRYKGQK